MDRFIEDVFPCSAKIYLAIYALFVMLSYSRGTAPFTGEYDEYSLPIASILHDGNFSISDDDIAFYGKLFPDMGAALAAQVGKAGISEVRKEDLNTSSFYAKDGSGRLTAYYPTYSIACLPLTVILKGLGSRASFAFLYTNLISLLAALYVLLRYLKVGNARKLLLLLLLTVSPVVFYMGWASAEVFITSLLIVSCTCWHSGMRRRAALFLSMAGTMNPTIMAIGFPMIAEFLAELWHERGGKAGITAFIRDNIREITGYGCCYIIGIVPMAYDYYNTGHINLPAGDVMSYRTGDSFFGRAAAYICDLNYGILPYFSVILIAAVLCTVAAFRRRMYGYLYWMAAFLGALAGYSLMWHINCGVSGIARYNQWNSVVLIFATVLFADELITKDLLKRGMRIAVCMELALSFFIVIGFGPYMAEKVPYTSFSPIAQWALECVPAFYSPLHSTFANRVTHVDGGYVYDTPVVYMADDGYVRKILAANEDGERILGEIKSETADGQAWLDRKVKNLGEKESYISVPVEKHVVRMPHYTPGEAIVFGTEGYNADDFIRKGIGRAESWGSWSEGTESEVCFQTESGSGVLHCDLDAVVYHGSQSVTVLANDEVVFEDAAFTGGIISFDFANPGRGKEIDIRFLLPDASSPYDDNGSPDHRVLALGFVKMVVASRAEK